MADLLLAIRAEQKHQRVAQQLMAWHVCCVLNPWLPRGKSITEADLLPHLRKPKVFRPSQFGGNIEAMKAAIQAEIDKQEGVY